MGRAFECRRRSKEARWDKMSKVFPKMAKMITMAAKEGGPDPESNAKLRAAILNAKAVNLPKDNIDSAIKRATGKEGIEITEVSYEGKAPHGVLLFIDCATDNTNRSVANLKSIFSKAGGQLVPAGSLEFLFNRRAVVDFNLTEHTDIDEVQLHLIDAGLEDFDIDDSIASAIGPFENFHRLSQAVETLGLSIRKASIQRLPTSPVHITEAQMIEIEILVDKIEDDDDVQAVFTNLA